jgi:hypothetical protein
MRAFLTSKAILAVIVFFAIEVVFFRTGAYNRIIKPASFAGMLLQRCQLAQAKHNTGAIALLGDSRLREGFSARIFDQLAAKTPVRALNLGLSGSNPRVWYYFLKNVDPNCASFKMIVIALPSYYDEDYAYGASDRQDDLRLLLPILSVRDAFDFTQSFQNRPSQVEVLTAMLLKMYGFRQDLKDLIANPLLRTQDCNFFDKHWQEIDYKYMGQKESLTGAHVVNNEIVGLPSFVTPHQRERLQLEVLAQSERDLNFHYPYLQLWLDKLSSRYAGSPTRLVFIRIPARPFYAPLKHQVHMDSIEAVSRLSNVIVDPENEFSFLEKPEYFFDDIHLNSLGRKIFSKCLSLKLIKYAQDNGPEVAEDHRSNSL